MQQEFKHETARSGDGGRPLQHAVVAGPSSNITIPGLMTDEVVGALASSFSDQGSCQPEQRSRFGPSPCEVLERQFSTRQRSDSSSRNLWSDAAPYMSFVNILESRGLSCRPRVARNR